MPRCENCDTDIHGEPFSVPDSWTDKSLFCSEECWLEAWVEIDMDRFWAREEFLLYGPNA